jgi:hypothetical protein
MTKVADAPYPVMEIQPDWLFKYPQPSTGQHWAEKIAAEVADALDILHARVELALFQDMQGSATESFAREGRERYHGNQGLAGQLMGYDPDKRFRQSDHTLDNIFAALDRAFDSVDSARWAKERLGEYLVLDALIGNTDRHHENWGILRKRTTGGWSEMLAPTFDHASSLGRELLDEGAGKSRRRILEEGRIAQYAKRAPGAIYWETTDRRGVSPMELIRRASDLHPAISGRGLKRLDKVSRDVLQRIVDRVPDGWMSELSRTFAVELMCYNLRELKRIAP